jgi:hypothetical protein
MANVTLSPGREGPIDVFVELEDVNEQPLAVGALSITLSDPERGIAPMTAKAERISATNGVCECQRRRLGNGRWPSASRWPPTIESTSPRQS